MTRPSSPCPPITDDAWPALLADLHGGFATGLNVYRTMAHRPALLRAWAPLRQHIVKDNALGPELLEVVILRAAFRLGSDYEWSQHVDRARKLGFESDRIEAVRHAPEGHDLLLVRAVDALLDDRRLTTMQEAELADIFGRDAVIDLIATVGFYSTLGYLLMTYETPLDDDIAYQSSKVV
jgi:alkylhydroperoxidase family enzyme